MICATKDIEFSIINSKNKLFCKIWHIHLYMSFFLRTFAPKSFVRMWVHVSTHAIR